MTPTDTTYGREYDANDWPHGLMCMDCDKVLGKGDRYAHRLVAMTTIDAKPATVEEVICLECALAVTP